MEQMCILQAHALCNVQSDPQIWAIAAYVGKEFILLFLHKMCDPQTCYSTSSTSALLSSSLW